MENHIDHILINIFICVLKRTIHISDYLSVCEFVYMVLLGKIMTTEYIPVCKHCVWVKVLPSFQVWVLVNSHMLYTTEQMQK